MTADGALLSRRTTEPEREPGPQPETERDAGRTAGAHRWSGLGRWLPTRRGSAPAARHRLELVVPLCCLAVLMVAAAYAGARRGSPSPALFWAGQVLLIGTVATASLSRRVDRVGRIGAVVAFTVAQYAIKLAYSPRQLKFADELQHWQTTLGMLDSDRLFPTNASLPISPVFPGLEAMTVTVMRVSGLSFFPAAVLVCGLCTLLATGVVWCIASRFTDRADIAAVVTLIYLCNPNHGSFSSMYLYVTPALAFLFLLALHAIDLLRRPNLSRVDGRLARIAAATLIVTHHITLLIGLAVLVVVSIVATVLPSRRDRRRPLWRLTAQVAAASLVWAGWIASGAVNYVSGPVGKVVGTVTDIGGGGGRLREAPEIVAPTRPLVETAFSAAAVLLVAGALAAIGLLLVQRRRAAAAAMVAAGLAMLALVASRALGAAGELVGRSFPYVTLGAAVALGYGATLVVRERDPGRWVRAARTGPGRRTLGAAAVGALVVIGIGGVTTGLPAFWQRLPGTFHPGGFESGIDARTMDLAWWTRRSLSPELRFISDLGNESATGSVGGLHPVQRAAPVFYRPAFDPADRQWIQHLAVDLVIADRRITAAPPITGSFFGADVEAGRMPDGVDYAQPFPAAGLDKFDRMADVGVLYDDGVIRVYDLRGSRYEW